MPPDHPRLPEYTPPLSSSVDNAGGTATNSAGTASNIPPHYDARTDDHHDSPPDTHLHSGHYVRLVNDQCPICVRGDAELFRVDL